MGVEGSEGWERQEGHSVTSEGKENGKQELKRQGLGSEETKNEKDKKIYKVTREGKEIGKERLI